MRVLESGATPSYNMGKNKKHKLRKTKEVSDSSDDALAVPSCNHINMAVNVAAMRKGLMKQVYGECASCTNETKVSGEGETILGAEAAPALLETEPTLWVCLQCGNQGCDRNSRDKHALKHYETPRSSCHCLVINTTSWTVWCYKCDDEVQLEQSKRLQESVDIIRKQAGLPQSETVRKQSQTISSSSVVDQAFKPSTLTPRSSGPCSKVKGLSNLGNTCFFNAVMQNLTQTPCIESVVVERSKKGRLSTLTCKGDSDLDSSSGGEDSDVETPIDLSPIEIVLPEAGPLTQTMIAFLQEMNNSTGRSSTVNPSPLFSQICKKAQRFRGFQQQDSHELLRYLLDNMRTEEIKRGQSGILKHFKLPENVNPKKVDDEMKEKIKEYGRQVKHTFVDSLFGGYLMSTVTCEECKNISQIFEPFLDLSLPVTEEKPTRPNQMLGGRKKESVTPDHHEETVLEQHDRPSKHLEKKLKKQAKREAKKKAKISKNRVSPSEDPDMAKTGEEEGEQEGAEKEEEGGGKEQDEESSSREDPSDADIEDNLESDTSRCFSKLSLENSITELPQSSQENTGADQIGSHEVDVGTSSSNTDTLTSGTSTSTIKQEEEEEVPRTSPTQNHTGDLDLKGDNFSNKDGHSNTKLELNGIHENPVFENECSTSDGCFNNCQENGDIENEEDIENSYRISSESNINIGIPKIKHLTNYESELCKRTNSENGEPQNGVHQMKKEGIMNGESVNSHSRNSSTGEMTAKLGNLILEDSTALNNREEGHRENSFHETQGGGSNCEKGSVNISTPTPQHSNNKKEIKKEALVRSKVTLGTKYHPTSRECTIMSCIHQFTSAELLTGNNKFGCAKCTQMKYKQGLSKDKKEKVYSNAAKQYLINTPPAVLTLHLKRFEQVGFSSRKVNRHVDFPFVLDLAPFCSSLCQGVRPGQKKVLYALYGVVEHSGRLNAGHYTAYVKVRPNIGITTDFLSSGAPSIKDCIKRYLEVQNSTASLEEQEESIVERLVPPGRWYHISDSRVSETTESTVQRAQAYLLFYERIY